MAKLPSIPATFTSPIARLLLQILGYVLVFIFSLLLFIYLFFPYDRWKGDIEEMLSTYTGKHVTIEDVGGWRLIGLKLEGVTLAPEEKSAAWEKATGMSRSKTAAEGKETAAGGEAQKAKGKTPAGAAAGKTKTEPLVFDSIALRPALLSFLGGSTGVIFSADIFDGSIDGKVKIGKKSSIDLDLDGLDVHKITFLEGLAGLPFIGKLDGTVDLDFAGKRFSAMNGDIELKVKDMQIGDKDSKLDLGKAGGGIIKGTVKFEPVVVGDLVMKLSGEDGMLKVVEMKSSSEHLQLAGGGEMKINQPVSASLLNIYIKFKFLDAYIQKSAMTKSVFSTLDRLTKFRQAKRTDGFWGFAIRGTLAGGMKPIPARVGPSGM